MDTSVSTSQLGDTWAATAWDKEGWAYPGRGLTEQEAILSAIDRRHARDREHGHIDVRDI